MSRKNSNSWLLRYWRKYRVFPKKLWGKKCVSSRNSTFCSQTHLSTGPSPKVGLSWLRQGIDIPEFSSGNQAIPEVYQVTWLICLTACNLTECSIRLPDCWQHWPPIRKGCCGWRGVLKGCPRTKPPNTGYLLTYMQASNIVNVVSPLPPSA